MFRAKAAGGPWPKGQEPGGREIRAMYMKAIELIRNLAAVRADRASQRRWQKQPK
jgi:hypothetical protein